MGRSFSRLCVVVLAASALAMSGSHAAMAQPAKPPAATRPTTADAKVAPDKITPAEQKFADAMVATMNAHEATKAYDMISRKEFAKRVTANLSGSPQDLEFVRKHLDEDRDDTSFSDLWDKKSEDTKVSLVRAQTVAKERQLLFRVRGSLIEYFYVVVQPEGDHVVGVDFWTPYYGEKASDLSHIEWLLTIQRAYNGAVESQTLLDMLKDFRAKEHQAVLATYEAFPAETKKKHWVQRFRVDAASHVDPEASLAASEDALKYLPNDPQCLITLEFSYANEKRWPELIRTLDALDAVYRDPQIADMKAAFSLDSGDPKLALKLAKEALAKDPKNEAMLGLLVKATLESEDWDALPAALNQWEKGTGESMYDSVRKEDQYKPFRKTAQGKAWLAEKKKSAAPAK